MIIEAYAKDGGQELYQDAFFRGISMGSLKIRTSNAMRLGERLQATIISVIVYSKLMEENQYGKYNIL